MQDSIEVINYLIKKGIKKIQVKSIRVFHNIPSSDRSKIHFISRSLDELTKRGVLKYIGKNSPKKYEIIAKEEISFKK